MKTAELISAVKGGRMEKTFASLYGGLAAGQPARYEKAVREFEKRFGADRDAEFFSAPGRTEIGGNHTDHQRGRVLAASVNLDVIGVAAKNDEGIIRIQSEGYAMDEVDLSDLSIHPAETDHAISLIRGIAARFHELGLPIGGFDAYTTSNVMKGSGLSSSAAFETLVGAMLNYLYAGEKLNPIEIAQVGQYAENVYFGKPCGLLDQTASSVGGVVTIDFCDAKNPAVEKLDVDFTRFGYRLCVVDTGGNHADLTGDYAAAPAEMRSVAAAMGKEVLREVDEADFFMNIAALREKCGDRAVLRAIHFYEDNDRVPAQCQALREGNFDAFLELVIDSGRSSFMYLQNVFTCQNPQEQGLSVALAVSERILRGRGAWRVHGGGFAGTIQCYVPEDLLETYRSEMEKIFGKGRCHVLSVRPAGGIHLAV